MGRLFEVPIAPVQGSFDPPKGKSDDEYWLGTLIEKFVGEGSWSIFLQEIAEAHGVSTGVIFPIAGVSVDSVEFYDVPVYSHRRF